jgi:hypothetical protein
MPSLQELQAPIDSEIVNAMIESTPDTWSQIVLTITRNGESSGIGDFSHELTSPDGRPPVGPADSLYEATYKLDQLLQSAGGVLQKAVYLAKAVEEKWSFSAKFEYSSPPKALVAP